MPWLEVIPAATVISVTVTLLVRYFDRPRPAFLLETQLERERGEWSSEASGEYVVGHVALTNAGAADAFSLEVFGDGCSAGIGLPPLRADGSSRWSHRIPRLEVGETVLVQVLAPISVREGDRSARLVIRWLPSPGHRFAWLLRGKREVVLADLDSAVPMPAALFEPRSLPRRWRRWRRLHLHTALGRQGTAAIQREQVRAEQPPAQPGS